jgi:hypothetical protein
MTPDSKPQRDEARFAASFPAVVHIGDLEHPCLALDLSRSGALVIGDLPEPDESELELSVRTPAGDREVRVAARVAYAGEHERTGKRRLGLQFGDLSDAQREALDALISRAAEGMAPASLEELNDGASLIEIREALSRIPLAHRVALARRALPRDRGFLRHDPEPQVLEALARNPSMVLPEIITLTRNPTLLPSTLEIIANDPRWAQSDELKIQIATHPRTTFMVADRVVARLGDLVLQRVIHRPGLHPAVREKVMRRLARKNRG